MSNLGDSFTTPANQKMKKIIAEKNSKVENIAYVPLSIFKDRSTTALEALVIHLKDLGFSFKEISLLINRDQRTIWTVYNRASKKRGRT